MTYRKHKLMCKKIDLEIIKTNSFELKRFRTVPLAKGGGSAAGGGFVEKIYFSFINIFNNSINSL